MSLDAGLAQAGRGGNRCFVWKSIHIEIEQFLQAEAIATWKRQTQVAVHNRKSIGHVSRLHPGKVCSV